MCLLVVGIRSLVLSLSMDLLEHRLFGFKSVAHFGKSHIDFVDNEFARVHESSRFRAAQMQHEEIVARASNKNSDTIIL